MQCTTLKIIFCTKNRFGKKQATCKPSVVYWVVVQLAASRSRLQPPRSPCGNDHCRAQTVSRVHFLYMLSFALKPRTFQAHLAYLDVSRVLFLCCAFFHSILGLCGCKSSTRVFALTYGLAYGTCDFPVVMPTTHNYYYFEVYIRIKKEITTH